MSSEKPSWAKTNVGWDIRKLIWQRWAMAETIKQTMEFFDLDKVKYENAPVDRNTIAAVRNELADLPLELLHKLLEEMPDIETFLKEQRRDFQGKQGFGKIQESKNWIDDYLHKHGELPLIPDWLAPIVKGYLQGMSVSKEMKLSHSPPYWDSLKPSQRKKVLQLVEWLGQDPDDYEELIKRHIPGSKSDIIVVPKRKLT